MAYEITVIAGGKPQPASASGKHAAITRFIWPPSHRYSNPEGYSINQLTNEI